MPARGLFAMRNDNGHFPNVDGAWAARQIGERDVVAGDLGGDSHPDLVQLSTSRIRVSVWRDGGWATTFERRISLGIAVAVGDADGDGHDDIFLQTGSASRNTADVLLRNNGHGTGFTTIAVPPPGKGSAQDVIALDWNSDGRSEFLVLNGFRGGGPVQLIRFGG